MKKQITIVMYLLSWCSWSYADNCIFRGNGVNQETEFVSMLNIINLPEKYTGKPIKVIGVLHFFSDGSMYLYYRKNAIDYVIAPESIKLELAPDQALKYVTQLKKINGKFVSVIGRFKTYKYKHPTSGYFEKITHICKAITNADIERMMNPKPSTGTP